MSRRTDSGLNGTTGHEDNRYPSHVLRPKLADGNTTITRTLLSLGFCRSAFNLDRGVPDTRVRESKELGLLSTVAPRQMAPVVLFPADLATRITRGVGT